MCTCVCIVSWGKNVLEKAEELHKVLPLLVWRDGSQTKRHLGSLEQHTEKERQKDDREIKERIKEGRNERKTDGTKMTLYETFTQ